MTKLDDELNASFGKNMNIPPESSGLRGENGRFNNLNQDNSSLYARISSIAVDLAIPFMIPAVTAFIGWVAQKQVSAQVKQLEEQKEGNKMLGEKINELQQIISSQSQHKKDDKKLPTFAPTPLVPSREQNKKIEEEENLRLQEINKDLSKVSAFLAKRQSYYCNRFSHRQYRYDVERDLKEFSYSRNYDKELGLYTGVLEILEKDKYCDSNGQRNGCMMWVYMDLWKVRARLLRYERVQRKTEHLERRNKQSTNEKSL